MVDAAILAGCDFTSGVTGTTMQAAINSMRGQFDMGGLQKHGISPQTVENIRKEFTPPQIEVTQWVFVTPQLQYLRRRMILECGMDEDEVNGLLDSYLDNLKSLTSILSLIQVNLSSPSG
jgi:hypothetical protein